MEIKKYAKELKDFSKNLNSEKPIELYPHKLKVREEDFKIFFESDEERSILKEWNFECLADLENYEKELKLGEFGD